MPLHEWFPAIMMPTGMCTDVPWQFMGVTMAEWMVVAFSGYLVMLLLFIVPILSGSDKQTLYKEVSIGRLKVCLIFMPLHL